MLALSVARSSIAALVFLVTALVFVALVTDFRGSRARFPGLKADGRKRINAGILWGTGLLIVGYFAWTAVLAPASSNPTEASSPVPLTSGAAQDQAKPIAVPTIAPAPTPGISDAVKAEAADLFAAAASRREAGELGLALELGRQALGKWPEYAEAKGFMAEVAPQATAQAEAAAQAAASATAEAEARQAALAEYGQKVAASSRRYADALGAFSQLATEAGQRPALILDDVWRTKAAAALAFMMNAADEMAAIQPVPPEMARVSDLLKQIAAETRLLTQDFGHGVDNLDAQRMQSARTRLERIGALATQATAEVQKVTR